ncbi:MAG: hypothetical protein K2N38_12610 [Oscillospiraceae bacterium]|nr:hypothetical protein [Oscillospiraceae bacterium]
MEKIRIQRNIKQIEVNDEGECIVLDFNDHSLPYKFLKMLNEIHAKQREFEEKLDAEGSLYSAVELEYEINLYFKAKIDELFGEGTCRKVYGDVLPSVEMHSDFLTQLTPYFEEYAKQRREKMSRYTAERTGNV